MCVFIAVVNNVPADGLAVVDARASASKVRTMFKSYIHIQDQHLQGQEPMDPINSLRPSDAYMRQ